MSEHRIARVLDLSSIRTRLVALTLLLVIATVAIVVWRWTTTQRRTLHAEKRSAADAIAATIAHTMMNEVDDANWSQIRVDINLLVADHEELAYVVVHSEKKRHLVVGAAPPELNEQFVLDVVPLAITRKATAIQSAEPLLLETFALRDIQIGERVRVHKADPLVEAVAAMRTASGVKIGTVRVGVSLVPVDAAVAAAVKNALAIGALAFVLALVGAIVVARRLARPIQQLASDAQQIAAGHLSHRAEIHRADEIGRLADAFNAMATDLEASFGKLKRTAASFERFVPRKFLNVVAPEGIENIVVGTGANRRVAVLFTDLRGFTSLSEELTPADVFELLNEYLARMGGVIDQQGGFVDKYIGDAIMALFDEEHTDGIVRACVGMRAALRAFNAERAARGLPPIESGIGVHGGEVIMGTIGFASKIESTVIGDAVNVASRVESMTKEYGVHVLITGDIVARLADREAFALRIVASGVAVRGRDEPIDLYTLVDRPDTTGRPDSRG